MRENLVSVPLTTTIDELQAALPRRSAQMSQEASGADAGLITMASSQFGKLIPPKKKCTWEDA